MSESIMLPTYPDANLAALSTSELIDLIIKDCDCVPRNVIDVCAERDDMTEYLQKLHEDNFLWHLGSDDFEDVDDGRWWLRFHAVMILGKIPSEQAGLLLVELMRRMSLEQDKDLQDWLSGYWSAQFLNKPESVLPSLHALCEDRCMDSYVRTYALDPLIAAAARSGGDALEQALEWLSDTAADEGEDWDYRLNCAALLLHFPRPQYRQLLEDLAMQQVGWLAYFDTHSIEQAYAGKYYAPEWETFNAQLEFYEPDAISKRQIRWREEAEREKERSLKGGTDYLLHPYDPYAAHEPYFRPEPKIGRNDPCPCGSGKKYKRCCIQ